MKPNTQSYRPNAKALVLALVLLALLVIVEYVDEFYLGKYSGGAPFPFPSPFNEWDLSVFKLINVGLSSPILDVVLGFITNFGSTVFWLVMAILLWVAGKKEDAILLAVAIIIGGVIFLPLKLIFYRARPYMVLTDIHVLDTESGFSFPSGHSKNVFSAAAILGNKHRKWASLLYVLSFVVSFSRIYIGVHWPIDVVVGAVAGWLIGIIVLKYETKILKLVEHWLKLSL
jgi:undecaprenyl-diphosphatase